MAVSNIASQLVGVSHVWSQVVMWQLVDRGNMSSFGFNRFTLDLLRRNYTFTWINSGVWEFALEASGWSTESADLRVILDQVGSDSVSSSSILAILGSFTETLFRFPDRVATFTIHHALLDAVLNRSDGQKMIRLLYRLMPNVFLPARGVAWRLAAATVSFEHWVVLNWDRPDLSTNKMTRKELKNQKRKSKSR